MDIGLLAGIMIAVGTIFIAVTSRIIFIKRHTLGTLYIDESDPEKDKYYFAMDDIACLSNKKKVVLKVKNTKRRDKNIAYSEGGINYEQNN